MNTRNNKVKKPISILENYMLIAKLFNDDKE